MERLTRIILVTNDTIYAGAFTEAVAATQSGFTVSVMTPAGDVVQSIVSGARSAHGAQPVRAGVRLIDESGRDGSGQGAVLTVSAVGAAEPFCVVDKYAGCGEICSKAVIAYSASTVCAGSPQRACAGHSAEIISVMGLEGGAGASSVALGLAGELSAYHDKRTMYLSFETFESPRLGIGSRMSAGVPDAGATESGENTGGGSGAHSIRTGGPVSDYLFDFLRSGERDGRREISVKPYLSRDDYGTVRFVPSAGFNRLHELSGDELERFIGTVTGEMRPDILVLDWGSCLCADTAEWLAGSSYAVFVGRHEGMKSDIGDGYKPGAETAGIAGVPGVPGTQGMTGMAGIAGELGIDEKKAVFVINRQPPETDAELPQGFIGISEDPYAFESDGGRLAISLATAFGTGVKKLADVALGAGDEAGVQGLPGNTENENKNERGRKIDELFAA